MCICNYIHTNYRREKQIHGSVAQMVEHLTKLTFGEVLGSNPSRAATRQRDVVDIPSVILHSVFSLYI